VKHGNSHIKLNVSHGVSHPVDFKHGKANSLCGKANFKLDVSNIVCGRLNLNRLVSIRQ
jgi:hypothetical protein